MSPDIAMSMIQEMLFVAAKVAGPILFVSLIVGLLISVLQVVTQIQEMTLTFVPKIIAVVMLIVILGPWMLGAISEFARSLYLSIPQVT